MKIVAIVLVFASVVATASAQRAVPSHGAPTRSTVREVARVNGVSLTSDRLDAAVNRLVPYESFHRRIGAEKMDAVRARALRTLIDEELEYQDGLRAAVKVTAAEVEAAVAKARKASESNADFDRRLRTAGVSIDDLRREIRRSLTIQRAEERTVTTKCQVSADEAARFFAANPDRFVMPEQLHVFAITIGVEPSAPSKVWSDARARAERVRLEIAKGASFAEMARTYSTDPSKASGGDMGFLHRGTLTDEFERAVHDLPLGRVSEIVQTLYGYHIIRVTEIRPPQRKTFAEVAVQIRKDLTTRRCADMKEAWLTRLRTAASVTTTGPAS